MKTTKQLLKYAVTTSAISLMVLLAACQKKNDNPGAVIPPPGLVNPYGCSACTGAGQVPIATNISAQTPGGEMISQSGLNLIGISSAGNVGGYPGGGYQGGGYQGGGYPGGGYQGGNQGSYQGQVILAGTFIVQQQSGYLCGLPPGSYQVQTLQPGFYAGGQFQGIQATLVGGGVQVQMQISAGTLYQTPIRMGMSFALLINGQPCSPLATY